MFNLLEYLEEIGGENDCVDPNTSIFMGAAKDYTDLGVSVIGRLIVPFGYSPYGPDSYNYLLEGNFGFKCMLLDFVSAVFRQLLPTAPALLILDHWTYRQNNASSLLKFFLDSLAAVMVVWPLTIVFFAFRVLSSIFVNPITYHAAKFFSNQTDRATAPSHAKNNCSA